MITKEQIETERDWRQKCLMISIYHTGKVAQYGKTRNRGWTLNKTSKELELSIGYISEELQLATHSQALISCETREEAIKKMARFK